MHTNRKLEFVEVEDWAEWAVTGSVVLWVTEVSERICIQAKDKSPESECFNPIFKLKNRLSLLVVMLECLSLHLTVTRYSSFNFILFINSKMSWLPMMNTYFVAYSRHQCGNKTVGNWMHFWCVKISHFLFFSNRIVKLEWIFVTKSLEKEGKTQEFIPVWLCQCSIQQFWMSVNSIDDFFFKCQIKAIKWNCIIKMFS